MALISEFDQRYLLGIPQMDDTHREFVELLNQLGDANKEDFKQLFHKLVSHTKAHFTLENMLMQETSFPAIREHMDEHQRVLGELDRMEKKVSQGNNMFPKAYLQQLPDWFHLHANTMDSALAAHLKHSTVYEQTFVIHQH